LDEVPTYWAASYPVPSSSQSMTDGRPRAFTDRATSHYSEPDHRICDALPMGETVVVGYDGQDRSDRVLARAIEVVKADGGKLVVVVAEPGVYRFGLPISGPDFERPLPGAQESIDRARKRLDEAGVSAECRWGVGDPAQVIVDAAREHDASRIMIGAHHHGFFERTFGEDVDAEVQRAAQCEVVLVE
jgi:nucleotide-binding universal stress UspA family protein